MERKAEIVIIGGGAIGSSIAYQLTRMGKSDVVVLERDELFSKASGANCGMVAPHYLYTDSHQLGIESMKILEELANQTDTDFKLNRCGELHLIEMEKHTGIVQEKLALYHKDGLKAEFLSPGKPVSWSRRYKRSYAA